MAFKAQVARSLVLAAALLAPCRAFAEDAPVEKPAVDRPALPQPSPTSPAEGSGSAHGNSSGSAQSSTRSSGHGEASSTKHSGGTRAESAPAGGTGRRVFPYLAAGPAILIGLSGGSDYERANPALTGGLGVEIPIGRATGLGLEVNGDVELAASSDRGTFTDLLVRARVGQMLTPRNRVWGALGIGTAGYQSN